MSSHTREDDHEGQEEGDEGNVECQRGHVRGDRGAVAVGVEGGSTILAKRIKPSARHSDDLASRTFFKIKPLIRDAIS